MSIENFNLHIAVPEDDNQSDPELIRLQAELMAIKPLLDDAIQRKSVSEAEELYKQALEAKKRLDEYKVSLEKPEEKEYKAIEINGVKVELGPELGEMTFDEIPAKLEEFNKTLKPGEKTWKVPLKEYFYKINEIIRAVRTDPSLSDDEKIIKSQEIIESFGLTWSRSYWCSDRSNQSLDQVWGWDSVFCSLRLVDKKQKRFVNLVRWN